MGPKVAEFEAALAEASGQRTPRSSRPGPRRSTSHSSRSRSGRATRSSSPPTPSRRRRTSSSCAVRKAVLVDVDPDTFLARPGRRRGGGDAEDARRHGRAPLRPTGRVGGAAERGPAGGRPPRGRRRSARRALPRHAVRRARRRRLPLVPPAEDRHDGRGRRGHDATRPTSTQPCAGSGTTAGRRSATCRRRASTTACRISSARSASRSCARLEELLAARERVAGWYDGAPRALRAHALGRRGRPARLAGVRRAARPPRRGAAQRSATRGSRRRSGRGRSIASSRTATQGVVPGRRRAPSSVRSRSRSRRRRPRRRSSASRRS